jgi:hypothetical protein
MSTVFRVLIVLVLLLFTNLATFLFFTWRCRQELAGEARLRESLSERAAAAEAERAGAQRELERLSVWGHFIELQQQLNEVERDLERLNFGNALERLDRLARAIEGGELGDALRERRGEVLSPLTAARQALRATQVAQARRHLTEVNERAFSVLSGIAPPRPGTAPPTGPPGGEPEPRGPEPREPERPTEEEPAPEPASPAEPRSQQPATGGRR